MGRFLKFSFDKMETIAVHIQRHLSQKISSPVNAAKNVLLCMGNGTLSAVQGGCFVRERDPRVWSFNGKLLAVISNGDVYFKQLTKRNLEIFPVLSFGYLTSERVTYYHLM